MQLIDEIGLVRKYIKHMYLKARGPKYLSNTAKIGAPGRSGGSYSFLMLSPLKQFECNISNLSKFKPTCWCPHPDTRDDSRPKYCHPEKCL